MRHPHAEAVSLHRSVCTSFEVVRIFFCVVFPHRTNATLTLVSLTTICKRGGDGGVAILYRVAGYFATWVSDWRLLLQKVGFAELLCFVSWISCLSLRVGFSLKGFSSRRFARNPETTVRLELLFPPTGVSCHVFLFFF